MKRDWGQHMQIFYLWNWAFPASYKLYDPQNRHVCRNICLTWLMHTVKNFHTSSQKHLKILETIPNKFICYGELREILNCSANFNWKCFESQTTSGNFPEKNILNCLFSRVLKHFWEHECNFWQWCIVVLENFM